MSNTRLIVPCLLACGLLAPSTGFCDPIADAYWAAAQAVSSVKGAVGRLDPVQRSTLPTSPCGRTAIELWRKGDGLAALRACPEALDDLASKTKRIIAKDESADDADHAWQYYARLADLQRFWRNYSELGGVRLPANAPRIYSGIVKVPGSINARWMSVTVVLPLTGYSLATQWPFGGLIVKEGPDHGHWISSLLVGTDGGIWAASDTGNDSTAIPRHFYRIGEYVGQAVEGSVLAFSLDPSLQITAGWTPELGENLTLRTQRLPAPQETFPGIRSPILDDVLENEAALRRTGKLKGPLIADWMSARHDAAKR